jgi:hypothetical protein
VIHAEQFAAANNKEVRHQVSPLQPDQVLVELVPLLGEGDGEGDAGGAPSSWQGILRVALAGSFTHLGRVASCGLAVSPAAVRAAALAAVALAMLTAWQSWKVEPWHMHTLSGPPGIRFLTHPQMPS